MTSTLTGSRSPTPSEGLSQMCPLPSPTGKLITNTNVTLQFQKRIRADSLSYLASPRNFADAIQHLKIDTPHIHEWCGIQFYSHIYSSSSSAVACTCLLIKCLSENLNLNLAETRKCQPEGRTEIKGGYLIITAYNMTDIVHPDWGQDIRVSLLPVLLLSTGWEFLKGGQL